MSTTTEYTQLVHSLGKTLLVEGGYALHHLHHANTSEVREIVQHLLVIRQPPQDVNDEDEQRIYEQVDAILALERQRQLTVHTTDLPTVSSEESSPLRRISLWKGDITSLDATAIVNAANSQLLGCFQPTHKCIDNVIHCKAGPRLRTACHEIMEQQGREEPVGSAKITSGFALPSKYVIHTVGPQLRRGASPTAKECEQLNSCYISSLDLLLKTVGSESKEDISVAFPCISTGLFAFPSDVAVPLVVNSVKEWLQDHPELSTWKVIFNTFLPRDYELYHEYLESQNGGFPLPPQPVDPALQKALQLVKDADYLVIAGGAGLSAAAGLDYTSEKVMQKFHPGIRKVLPSFRTMYNSIGHTDWDPPLMWGYLFKQISVVRFDWVRHRTAPTYDYLKAIRARFENREPGSTFVITTNADGMFEQEGFPTESIYIMQGSYGRIQCKRPCRIDSIWDSKPFMEKALESFNPSTYRIEDPAGIPKCPNCNGGMFLHLRVDGSFLQNALDGKKREYKAWCDTVVAKAAKEGKKLVIVEIGAGFNTPGVIRFPDERLATYDGVSLVRINAQHPEIPFESNGVGLSGDANPTLQYIAEHLAP
ncbi:hypothetical protein Poli38472_003761 [Pythium oligandrum]|uniref:Protein-ADP-ribose hydrolase n=1 Tax=Pythium oligandrum TaxID=41045 RepID=A0A8K1CNR8_PYTOL|nr:hypothetical protein Poli38472_003761 [Pythium oligandrum]|eukprot:TMW65996.1 hypothetical protein Poli38472_003761 [Pythium oligandrum]